MNVCFWGTRGSIPSPGQSTVRYGGNTSCVEVRLDNDTLIILDAGSGIRALGATLEVCRATLLVTHYHWDHIQGMPFFGPAYSPDCTLRVFGPEWNGAGPEKYLGEQMTDPWFPAPAAHMRACKQYGFTPDQPFDVGGAIVRAGRVCHPSNTLGYRLEADGVSLVYMSDNEVDLAPPDLFESMIGLAGGADILIHDCQYSEDEYQYRRGWGHSTPRQAVHLAREAGVGHLVLSHHDPTHSDEQVEALAQEARALAPGLTISIGREGATLGGRSTGTLVAM